MNKETVLDFIAELVFPIDPLVFAGYGTKYQNDVNNCFETDNSAQFLDIEENFISTFIDNCDINKLLNIMIDILIHRPNEYSNNLPLRREEDWNYYVNIIISNIGNREPEFVIEKLNYLLLNNNDKRQEIIEILSFMDCKISYKKIKEIKIYYKDLSEIELEMISDIEKEYNQIFGHEA